MFGIQKATSKIHAPQVLDGIEKEIYDVLKPLGFRKHGRTLHRFVEGDISQVINFQLGQAYREETHLMWVNIGIRIPECSLRSFQPEEKSKKYYHEYECTIRSRLGEVEGKAVTTYNLHRPVGPITADILRQLRETVLPVFEMLSSRAAILAHRREWPDFDRFNGHLILLEESMIFGRRGDLKTAEALFRQYFHHVAEGRKKSGHHAGHLRYLQELAETLGIRLNEPPAMK